MNQNESYIWMSPIPAELNGNTQSQLCQLLSHDELVRYNNMGSERRRVEYLVGHGLARIKIAEVLGFSQTEVPVYFARDKKPQLNVEGYYFSLSHCADLVVCCLSRYPVGIDINDNKPAASYQQIVKNYFSTEELSELLSIKTEVEQHRYFCRLWALKEALYKALDNPPLYLWKNFVFEFGETCRVQHRIRFQDDGIENMEGLEIGSIPDLWEFSQFELDAKYYMAVALQADYLPEFKIIKVSLDDLLESTFYKTSNNQLSN